MKFTLREISPSWEHILQIYKLFECLTYVIVITDSLKYYISCWNIVLYCLQCWVKVIWYTRRLCVALDMRITQIKQCWSSVGEMVAFSMNSARRMWGLLQWLRSVSFFDQSFSDVHAVHRVAWWHSGLGIRLLIKRSWVQLPVRAWLHNNSGQVVHTAVLQSLCTAHHIWNL